MVWYLVKRRDNFTLIFTVNPVTIKVAYRIHAVAMFLFYILKKLRVLLYII